jgi:hypothetical protein
MIVKIGDYDLVASGQIIQLGEDPIKITLPDEIEGDFSFLINFKKDAENPQLLTKLGFGTAGIEDKNKGLVPFKNSIYTNANLFIKITPFFTAGIEYIYGENNFTTGVKGMNHRVQIGVQVF